MDTTSLHIMTLRMTSQALLSGHRTDDLALLRTWQPRLKSGHIHKLRPYWAHRPLAILTSSCGFGTHVSGGRFGGRGSILVQKPSEDGCGFFVGIDDEVGVDIERGGRVAVAEPTGDRAHVDAGS